MAGSLPVSKSSGAFVARSGAAEKCILRYLNAKYSMAIFRGVHLLLDIAVHPEKQQANDPAQEFVQPLVNFLRRIIYDQFVMAKRFTVLYSIPEIL